MKRAGEAPQTHPVAVDDRRAQPVKEREGLPVHFDASGVVVGRGGEGERLLSGLVGLGRSALRGLRHGSARVLARVSTVVEGQPFLDLLPLTPSYAVVLLLVLPLA